MQHCCCNDSKGYFGSSGSRRVPRAFPGPRKHVPIFPEPICGALWKPIHAATQTRFPSFSTRKKSTSQDAGSISPISHARATALLLQLRRADSS